ncbi:MAG TPA: hypothetical protein VGX50_00305, partial [Longimicrobium sp.]|nr:hypothetical protein [Longimicrobium sp.]
MQIVRTLSAAVLCAAVLGACADNPAQPRVTDPDPSSLLPVGVYEVTITGADGSGRGGPASSRILPVQGPSEALNEVPSGIVFENLSTVTYLEGTRATGGQRFIVATFRVRNNTGAPLTNLTFIPTIRTTTITGTPFSSLLTFGGAAVPASVAAQLVPSGSVVLGEDGRVNSSYPDVLQVFTEAEVAA